MDQVLELPTDSILTGRHNLFFSSGLENLKVRIVNLIHMKDKGIIGAFMLYQDDRDFEGFKARVIHKLVTPSVSRETTYTARFNFPSTAPGG